MYIKGHWIWLRINSSKCYYWALESMPCGFQHCYCPISAYFKRNGASRCSQAGFWFLKKQQHILNTYKHLMKRWVVSGIWVNKGWVGRTQDIQGSDPTLYGTVMVPLHVVHVIIRASTLTERTAWSVNSSVITGNNDTSQCSFINHTKCTFSVGGTLWGSGCKQRFYGKFRHPLFSLAMNLKLFLTN